MKNLSDGFRMMASSPAIRPQPWRHSTSRAGQRAAGYDSIPLTPCKLELPGARVIFDCVRVLVTSSG